MRLSLVRGHLEHRRETEQLYSLALMARYFHVCRMDTPTVKAYVHCWYLSWLRLDVLLQYPPPVAPAVAQSAALSRQLPVFFPLFLSPSQCSSLCVVYVVRYKRCACSTWSTWSAYCSRFPRVASLKS
jgi:hypothetical protein